jgi:hypothetical protein
MNTHYCNERSVDTGARKKCRLRQGMLKTLANNVFHDGMVRRAGTEWLNPFIFNLCIHDGLSINEDGMFPAFYEQFGAAFSSGILY